MKGKRTAMDGQSESGGRPMTVGRLAATAAVFALAISAPGERATAQTVPSSYRFIESGQGVSLFWGNLALQTGSYELGPKSGSMMGARYSIEASGPLFIEGLATYLPTARDVIDPRRAAGDRSIGEADVHMVMVDARLAFSLTGRRTWNRIAPHLFLGGGIAIDLAGASELNEVLLAEDIYDFGTAFSSTSGVGMRVELGSRLMLHAEAGLTLWQINTPGGFDGDSKQIVEDPETESVIQSEWVRGYGLSASLGWRF